MKYCKRNHPQNEENAVRNKEGKLKDCRACVRVRANEWYQNNKEKANQYGRDIYKKNRAEIIRRQRVYVLKKKYGISPEEYRKMFREQRNKCGNKGCRRTISPKNAHLDHDHLSGRLRGLLCGQCNLALGLLGDNVKIIQGLEAYLQKSCEE